MNETQQNTEKAFQYIKEQLKIYLFNSTKTTDKTLAKYFKVEKIQENTCVIIQTSSYISARIIEIAQQALALYHSQHFTCDFEVLANDNLITVKVCFHIKHT